MFVAKLKTLGFYKGHSISALDIVFVTKGLRIRCSANLIPYL